MDANTDKVIRKSGRYPWKEDILYFCDRKACETCHPNNECKHTHLIEHAKNFEKVGEAYFEVQSKPVILKLNTLLRPEDFERVRQCLIKQITDGILLLPATVETVLLDVDDVVYEIRKVE